MGGDVLVRRATLSVAAASGERAVRGLDALEKALRTVLTQLADEIGNDLVVVDTLELAFQVVESGRPIAAAELEVELRRALRARLDAARPQSDHFSLGRHVARFSSESMALAEYLRAIARGQAEAWPFRALRGYGVSWDEVLANCLSRDRLLLADVLANVSRLVDVETVARQTTEALSARIVSAWTAADGERSAHVELPDEISSQLLADAQSGAWPASRGQFGALIRLFALWPPARALVFGRAQIAELVKQAPESAALRRASMAGGLLVLAKLTEESGFEHGLALAYPAPRSRRVVRWAIGRALENARLSLQDPLLAMWAGERPDAIIAPLSVLDAEDPEPLHRLALDLALRAELLVELHLVPFGDEIVLLAVDQLVVDAVSAAGVHEAVPELVRRFTQRAARPPEELAVSACAIASDLDAIAEIDAPVLPRAWQPAVRAAASLVRALLLRRCQACLSDVRGWPAIAENEDTIELRRRDAARVADGTWLDANGVMLGERRRVVRLV